MCLFKVLTDPLGSTNDIKNTKMKKFVGGGVMQCTLVCAEMARADARASQY